MKKLITCMLVFISFLGFSQVDLGSLIKNYAIKFTPTQLMAGELNFSYEQRVAKRISLELEVGPTISQFGINFGNQRIWQGELGVWDFRSLGSDADANVGFHVSLAPRFYPVSDEYSMKGFYLSPLLKYRKYNYTIQDPTSNLEITDKASIDQMVFRFNMGIQFWPRNSNFVLDMYFGVGLGTFSINGKYVHSHYDPVDYEYKTEWIPYRDSGVRFNIATGLRLGFGK